MKNDTATAPNLKVIASDQRPRGMSAAEREAYQAGRAAAQRQTLRELYGGENYEPQVPFDLSDMARKHWDAAVQAVPGVLRKRGIEDALARYCIGMATLEKANAEIEKTGLLSRGREGQSVKNPLLSIRSSAMFQIREARNDLGFPSLFRSKSCK